MWGGDTTAGEYKSCLIQSNQETVFPGCSNWFTGDLILSNQNEFRTFPGDAGKNALVWCAGEQPQTTAIFVYTRKSSGGLVSRTEELGALLRIAPSLNAIMNYHAGSLVRLWAFEACESISSLYLFIHFEMVS